MFYYLDIIKIKKTEKFIGIDNKKKAKKSTCLQQLGRSDHFAMADPENPRLRNL